MAHSESHLPDDFCSNSRYAAVKASQPSGGHIPAVPTVSYIVCYSNKKLKNVMTLEYLQIRNDVVLEEIVETK